MASKFATTLSKLSLRKKPRRGQRAVAEEAFKSAGRQLNIKLPTGYGKTFTALLVFAILRLMGRVDRLLVIVPTRSQLNQFLQDGESDAIDAGLTDAESKGFKDVSYFGARSIQASMRGSFLFVCTVQSIITRGGTEVIHELMQSGGNWMVVADEYQHLGIGKAWGDAVRGLPAAFVLAMSATPYRPNNDSAFGEPDVVVRYREAADELAVKRMIGHSYIYRVDAILEDGEVKSYTTSELADEAGGTDPDSIEKLRINRSMRWSPKYISPLLTIPINRLDRDRVETGLPLQAIVAAMCVSHAKLVAKQLKDMFPEYRIDWVGTGPDGRSDSENDRIITKFCPPKDPKTGKRPPAQVDILVHVGMAGEGLDCVNVTEVSFLNAANINNTSNQFIGRLARFLNKDVVGNVNFDSSSPYHDYRGRNIELAVDELPPEPCDDEPDERDPNDIGELPDEPTILDPSIINMELLEVRADEPDVERMQHFIADNVTGFDRNDIGSPKFVEVAIDALKQMRIAESEKFNEQSIVEQWREKVKYGTSHVTGRVIKMMQATGLRIEKSMPGDIKKRINQRKRRQCGALDADVAILKRHYEWLVALECELQQKGVPPWLA